MSKRILLCVVCVMTFLTGRLGAQDSQTSEKGRVAHLSEETFSSEVADFEKDKGTYLKNIPCVVDFYAAWCKPCKKLSPTLDSLAYECQNSIRFFKVDVAQTPELVKAYELEYVPSFLFCKDGKVELVREVNGDFRTYVAQYFSQGSPSSK